jgi:hypothetical protein
MALDLTGYNVKGFNVLDLTRYKVEDFNIRNAASAVRQAALADHDRAIVDFVYYVWVNLADEAQAAALESYKALHPEPDRVDFDSVMGLRGLNEAVGGSLNFFEPSKGTPNAFTALLKKLTEQP